MQRPAEEPHGPDRLAEGGAQEKGDGGSERGRRGLNASEWGKRVVAIEEREMDSGRTHSNANGVSASFNTLLLMHASMRVAGDEKKASTTLPHGGICVAVANVLP